MQDKIIWNINLFIKFKMTIRFLNLKILLRMIAWLHGCMDACSHAIMQPCSHAAMQSIKQLGTCPLFAKPTRGRRVNKRILIKY